MQEIKILVGDIIDRAYRYEDKKVRSMYKRVILELAPQRRRDFMGMYKPEIHKIMVYNINRSSQSILITVLHELAHHIMFVSGRNLGHDKVYLTTYELLVHTAMDMHLLCVDDLLGFSGTADAKWLREFAGTYEPKSYDYGKGRYVVKAKIPYRMREKASEMGFHFSALEKTWNRTLDEEDLENIVGALKVFIPENDIFVSSVADMQVETKIYIAAIGDTTEYVPILKENGFSYAGKGQWRKLILLEECAEELDRLDRLEIGLTFAKQPAAQKGHDAYA